MVDLIACIAIKRLAVARARFGDIADAGAASPHSVDVDAGQSVVAASKVRTASRSGIVTGMATPGTYRESDGSRVEFAVAVAAWTAAAVPVLERVARNYHATISYKDLGDDVQQVTGIRTRVLLMNWIGQVLGDVSRISHQRGQPMLSALCVHSDGTVGEGYGQAILDNYGGPLPGDLDMHAAEERLRCYQGFGADLPPGGGKAALTPLVAARRAWLARQSRADVSSSLCPACNLALPVSGICDNCGQLQSAAGYHADKRRQVGTGHETLLSAAWWTRANRRSAR
jgi:hypothetical protein